MDKKSTQIKQRGRRFLILIPNKVVERSTVLTGLFKGITNIAPKRTRKQRLISASPAVKDKIDYPSPMIRHWICWPAD